MVKFPIAYGSSQGSIYEAYLKLPMERTTKESMFYHKVIENEEKIKKLKAKISMASTN